jgi:hypothetical protein
MRKIMRVFKFKGHEFGQTTCSFLPNWQNAGCGWAEGGVVNLSCRGTSTLTDGENGVKKQKLVD